MADRWIEVDRKGLGAILDKRGRGFAVLELLQNALDAEGATEVDVRLTECGRARAVLAVEDNSPAGWADLSHAWTMFAPSAKAGNAGKRGRFNLGEKLVLALAREGRVQTMEGLVEFRPDGTRRTSRRPGDRMGQGTRVMMILRMTLEQLDEALALVRLVIPPPGVVVRVNGEVLQDRGDPVAEFRATLPTEVADEAGFLRKAERVAEVKVYRPLPGCPGTLYEMGLPVVETGDGWDVDVAQKVPLNLDRDNVAPSYLRRLRPHVLNAVAGDLTAEDTTRPWVLEAAGDREATADTVERVLDGAFGERRVMRDPSDPEANGIAFSRGYVVVSGNSLPAGVRENVRRFREEGRDLLPPAGKVTPSPRAYVEGGRPVGRVTPTEAMAVVGDYSLDLAEVLLGFRPKVDYVNAPNFAAAWCGGQVPELHFSVRVLGYGWFSRAAADPKDLDRLLLRRDRLEQESQVRAEDAVAEASPARETLRRQEAAPDKRANSVGTDAEQPARLSDVQITAIVA